MEYRIVVVVDVSQARANTGRLRGDLRGVKSDADAATRALANMARAVAGSLVVREVGRITDAYQNLRNRIRNVSDDVDGTYGKLFEIAQKTRQPIESIGQIFQRTALATREMGISADTAARFTEKLAQIVAYSGSTTAEASGAMIQLTQALGSGRFSGEEFRSVAEQIPEVLRLLAADLGVATGQLKAMGQEGKLTPDVIIGGILRMSNTIDERFGKTLPTLAQRIETVKNSFQDWAGQMAQNSGVYKALGDVLGYLASNMDAVGDALLVLLQIFAGLAIYKGIMLVVSAVKALNVAASANPFGLMIKSLLVLVPLLISFREEVGKLLDRLSPESQAKNRAIQRMAEFEDARARALAPLAAEKSALGPRPTLTPSSSTADFELAAKHTAMDVRLTDEKIRLNKLMSQVSGDISDQEFRSLIFQADPTGRYTATRLPDTDSELKAAKEFSENLKKGGKEAKKEWDEFLQTLNALLETLDPLGKLFADLTRDMATLDRAKKAGLTTGGPRGILNPTPGEGLPASYDEELRIQAESLYDLALSKSAEDRGGFMSGPDGKTLEEELEQLKELEDLYKEFNDEIVSGTKEMNEVLRLHRLEQDGIERGWRAIAATATDMAGDIERAMLDAFNGMVDELTNLLMGVETNFTKLVDSIIADLFRMGIKAGFAQLGGALDLPGFAGGVADYRVGGHGGEDSQMVMMRLSPSEHLSVSPHPPSLTDRDGAQREAPEDARAPVQIMFPWEPGSMVAVSRSREGRRAMAENIETDAHTLDAILRTSSGRRH